LQLTVPTAQTTKRVEILKLLCVALLDDFHLSLECDALGVANNPHIISYHIISYPNPWTENSQRCD